MRPMSPLDRSALTLAAACLLMAGCLPYTVGSTARPVAPGEKTQTGSLYAIPGAVEDEHDSLSVPMRGADVEVRFGIDDYSDFGLRIPMASGVVLNYKRRLDGPSEDDGVAVAVMAGGGFVNWGEHAMVELTFLASAPDRGTWTPYGGIRGMQVMPLSRHAVSDQPTVGGFFGIRFGRGDFGVSPEVGIYHDPSALELRERKWLIIPSVSIHGDQLMSAIGDLMGWGY